MYKQTHDPVAQLTGDPKKRVYTDPLRVGVRRHHLDLNLGGTVDITVAATRVVNRGSVLGCWQRFGFIDGNDEIFRVDARTLGFLADLLAPSARSTTRLAGTGVAATALKESIRIAFAWPRPFSAIPSETAYVDRQVGGGAGNEDDKKVRFYAELRTDGGTGGVVQGGTASMSTGNGIVPFITMIDTYDDVSAEKPALLPGMFEDLLDVPGTSAAFRYDVAVPDFDALRAIIIQTDSPEQGEVPDIINALRLRIGSRDIIGPAQVPWEDAIRGMEARYGGGVANIGATYGNQAYLAIVFQENGRLANCLPTRGSTIKFEFNWKKSVLAGVTNSQVRITYLGLQRAAGRTKDNLPYMI